MNRVRGLSILKNLPRGLEALVFGTDLTPELLTALSLGGRPGLQLSTIAMLMSINFGFNAQVMAASTMLFLSRLLDVHTPPKRGTKAEPSQMDDGIHEFILLDGQPERQMRVHLCGTTVLSLARNAHVVVVGFSPSGKGLVVYGEADGHYYYCENRFGCLELSSVDVSPNSINVTATNTGSKVFMVAPKVLEDYSHFVRLIDVLGYTGEGVVGVLGVMKVAKDMAETFAEEITGEGVTLLSSQHLRRVHTRLDGGIPRPQMPTDVQLRSLVQEASERLPLCDRNFDELSLFGTMQETTSGYVEVVERFASRSGNVGVQEYDRTDESLLIKSSVVQAVGMDPVFAIFKKFKKHKLNIAISPGCTAVYFPGLSQTVAFAEGSAVLENVRLRPACPFTTDLQESLSILVDLAPKLAKGRLTAVAKTLSTELAKNPALALNPLTRKVVRSFCDQGRASRFYLSKLFAFMEKRHVEKPFGEASVAGILFQLGLTFCLPQVSDPCDLRCFFERCSEVWRPGCIGVEVCVDCGVDISGCGVYRTPQGLFLKHNKDVFKLTGPVADTPWDELQPCDDYHHLERNSESPELVEGTSRCIPVPCYVGSPVPVRESVARG